MKKWFFDKEGTFIAITWLLILFIAADVAVFVEAARENSYGLRMLGGAF